MKALVAQLETQCILPVNPRAHGLRRLPVAEVFSKLHDTDQRQLPRVHGGLPFAGIDGAKELIVEKHAQFIAHPHVHVPSGKCGVCDTGSLSGNWL